MDIIADILLAAGATGAGIYCYVLGRRLNRFNSRDCNLLFYCRRRLNLLLRIEATTEDGNRKNDNK